MAYALSFSDVTVTDAHVGTPEQVVQIHFELRNTGDQPLPANAAYIIGEGNGGDRIAEGSHWVDEEIAAGYAGAEHRQPQAPEGGAYLLTLAITQFEAVDGGMRVHYAGRDDGTADAPQGPS